MKIKKKGVHVNVVQKYRICLNLALIWKESEVYFTEPDEEVPILYGDSHKYNFYHQIIEQ